MSTKSVKTNQQTVKTASSDPPDNNVSLNTASTANGAAQLAPTPGGAGVPENTRNNEILEAIRMLRADSEKQHVNLLEAINGIKGDMQLHSQRLDVAEERISTTEDDINTLQEKVKQLQQTVEVLNHKVKDHEDRNRRSNVRLIGLPEKVEGADMCVFLEKWLKVALVNCFASPPVIERAHRIGPVNSSTAKPRVVIIKFLNYRDREATLRAARKIKKVYYEEQQVSFFPDLSSETRQRQRCFDGVKAQLRTLNIRYGMLYPAHLIVTHNDRSMVFRSVAQAEDYIKKIAPHSTSTID